MIERFVGSRISVLLLVAIVCVLSAPNGPSKNIDSRFYLSVADDILRGDFRIFGTSEGAGWSVIGFPIVLACAKTIAPTHWIWVVWAINIMSSAFTAVLLVVMVHGITRSALAAAVALLFYVGAFDIVIWTRFVLGDTFYGVLACATFFLLASGLVGKELVGRRWWLALTTLACFVTRPTGLVVVPVVLIVELLVRPAVANPSRKRLVLWVLLAFGVLGASWFRGYVFQDMRRWPTDYMRPKLEEYAAREKSGEVVYDRAETRRRPPLTIADHLLMQTDRFVRFFQFTSPTFSRLHQWTSIAYYVSLYVLGIIGTVAALGGDDRRRRAIVQIALLWIFGTALLSAVTVLDYDWRYRLPAMPQLILLAGCGAQVVSRALYRNVSLVPADRPSPGDSTH